MKKTRYVFVGTGLALLAVAAVSIMGAVAIAAPGVFGPSVAQYLSATAATKQVYGPNAIGGTVINEITRDGVQNVRVIASSEEGLKLGEMFFTDAQGEYLIEGLPPDQSTFTLTFLKKEYFPGTATGVVPGAHTEVLRPLGVSTPHGPIANAAPAAVYIEWDANPEYNIKEYRIWRTETDEDGTPTGTEEMIAEILRDSVNDHLPTEYRDANADKGVYYSYQIQAISGADRPSVLSDPSSPPARGQYVTIFFPPLIEVASNLDGLYLGNFTLTDVSSPEEWLRIPVSARSAYEVNIAAMDIVAHLPADLVHADSMADAIEILPSGITEGMVGSANVGTDILPDGQPGDLRVSAASALDTPLYGSGVLFDIYVKVKVAQACGLLDLLEDDPGVFDGTLLYDVLGAGLGNSLDLILEDGELCVNTQTTCLHGDVDNNGVIDDLDVKMVLDISTRLVLADPDCPDAGDINLDGRINSADASQLQRWLAEMPLNPGRAGTKSLEERKAVAFAAGTKQDEQPVVWIDRANGQPGEEIEVSVWLSGSAPSAGFGMVINYLANTALEPAGLTYVTTNQGPGLPAGFLMVANNATEAGSDKGSLLISASSLSALGQKATLELITITFTLGSSAPADTDIDLVLTAFESSDSFAHTPRHGAPGQATIVLQAPGGEGSGEGEGAGDGAGEGEGAGDGAGEGEGAGDGAGEGAGDGGGGGCAATDFTGAGGARGDLLVLMLVGAMLLWSSRRKGQESH